MPGGRNHCGLALRTRGSEEVDGFVVLVGEAHREYHVTGTHVEGGVNETGDVELLESYFTALFDFGFVFAVFGVLNLVGCSYAARLKFDLGTENPFGVELIVEGEDEAGNGDGVAAFLAVAVATAVEAVYSVVLEAGYHFAVTAEAELLVVVVGADGLEFLFFFLH